MLPRLATASLSSQGLEMLKTVSNKPTCYAFLALNDHRLPPEAKYFLIRIFYFYGDDLVTETVKKLAKKVGLTEAAFSKARSLLCSLGYVELPPCSPEYVEPSQDGDEESENKKKRGRPRLGLRIAPKIMKEIRSSSAKQLAATYQNNHPKLLEKLLFWRDEGDVLRAHNVKKSKKTNPDSPRQHTFTMATRMLLATLYSRADSCGVVINLSLYRLSKLTGISEDRLDSQLKIIKNLGYMIDRISGLTGKCIFGRAASTFYMNISDDDCQSVGSLRFIAFDTNILNHYNDRFWGFRLYNEARYNDEHIFNKSISFSDPKSLAMKLNISYFSIDQTSIEHSENLADQLVYTRNFLEKNGLYGKKKNIITQNPTSLFAGDVNSWIFYWCHAFFAFRLHDFFYDNPIFDFAKYLQHRIDQYTASLLNIGWEKINIESLVFFDDIINRIKVDLFPRPLKDDDQEAARKSALALFIYSISYQQALMIKSLILKADIIPKLVIENPSSYSFAILPTSLPIDSFANRIIITIRGVPDTQFKSFDAVKIFEKQNQLKFERSSKSHNFAECQEIFRISGYDITKLQSLP